MEKNILSIKEKQVLLYLKEKTFDFRKVKGDWELPYKTEMYGNNELMSTTLVKSVEINKGLSDDLFNPDKVKIKGFNMQEMMKKMIQQKRRKFKTKSLKKL